MIQTFIQISNSYALAGAPQRSEALALETALGGEVADVANDELLVEDLVARRHGRVRREDEVAPDLYLECVVGLGAVGDERTKTLELEEGGMPFVQVEDGRLDPEHRQRAHTADAEQKLLADAALAVAAVEGGESQVDLEGWSPAIMPAAAAADPGATPPPRSACRGELDGD